MAKKDFVIRKGMIVGLANVDAVSGNISTAGNIFTGRDLTVNGSISTIGNATVGSTLLVTGDTFGANIYQNGYQVLDSRSRVRLNVERQEFTYTTPAIPLNDFHDFEMELGVSVVIYNLTVSRPCKIEVFGSEDKTESNPYTFVATANHLSDDGSVLLSDGSIIQSRQYSIFANLETPAQPKVYARVRNIDNVTDPVTITLTYFIGVAGLFT